MRSENAPVLLDTRCPEPDDGDIAHLLDAATAAAAARWAELRLVSSDDRRTLQTYRVGSPDGRGTPVELPIDDRFAATLILGSDRPPSDAVLRLVALGLTHVLRARRFLEQASLLGSALDTTTSAVLLFDDHGSIVYANPPGDVLLSRQTEHELRVACDGRGTAPLITEVCRRAERLAGSGPQSHRGLLALSDGSTMMCELLRVRVGVSSPAVGVLALLQRVGDESRVDLEAFSDSHGLSRREAEVTHLLLDGCTTADIAERLGISSHTVRDHLKHVYRKTDTRSRSELLSRLAGALPAGGGNGAAERA